jgi:hypothetical protein
LTVKNAAEYGGYGSAHDVKPFLF